MNKKKNFNKVYHKAKGWIKIPPSTDREILETTVGVIETKEKEKVNIYLCDKYIIDITSDLLEEGYTIIQAFPFGRIAYKIVPKDHYGV